MIEDLSARLVDAVNCGNLDGVLSVWDDDGVLMPPGHPAVHGRAAIEEYFRQLFARARLRFVFTESVISIDASTATQRVTYTAESWLGEAPEPVTDRGKGLHVFKRNASGEWKLAIDIWNSDVRVR